jgi:hypothetical protein
MQVTGLRGRRRPLRRTGSTSREHSRRSTGDDQLPRLLIGQLDLSHGLPLLRHLLQPLLHHLRGSILVLRAHEHYLTHVNGHLLRRTTGASRHDRKRPNSRNIEERQTHLVNLLQPVSHVPMQVTNHTSQGYAAGRDRNRRLVDQPLNGHRPSLTAARTGLRVQSAQSPEKRGRPGNDLHPMNVEHR